MRARLPADEASTGGRAIAGVGCAAVAAWLFVVVPTGAQAEENAYDSDDIVYATGAVFETEEELAGKPRTPIFRAFLPPEADLCTRFPAPGAQGEQGSCVGWAVGYAARSYYVSLLEGRRLDVDAIPSPAYIYNAIPEPGAGCDTGGEISDALDLLKAGAVAFTDYPYDERLCRRPDAGTVVQASEFRIAGWRLVDGKRFDQVRGELATGHPVVIGMRPDRDFHRLRGPAVWRAGRPEQDDGHHAITVVGYSEPGQHFHVMNSWVRAGATAGSVGSRTSRSGRASSTASSCAWRRTIRRRIPPPTGSSRAARTRGHGAHAPGDRVRAVGNRGADRQAGGRGLCRRSRGPLLNKRADFLTLLGVARRNVHGSRNGERRSRRQLAASTPVCGTAGRRFVTTVASTEHGESVQTLAGCAGTR